MTRNNKPLLRLALAIREQLTLAPPQTEHGLPEDVWQQCRLLSRRLHRAEERGWILAARQIKRDYRDMVRRLRSDVESIVGQFGSPYDRPIAVTTAVDIYHDLLALHEEFDSVSFDRRGQTLSVTTEPIELEGVYLGPFEIKLDWGDLAGHPGNYEVIATDEHPAASNESVTHPHVQDRQVCEGDGRVSIRSALAQGRLLDFFLIVANLLRTYNSGSPYVALNDWEGVLCDDCGSSTLPVLFNVSAARDAVLAEPVAHFRQCHRADLKS